MESEQASGRDVEALRDNENRTEIATCTDGSVGVLSRAQFFTQVQREKRRADRSHAQLSVVLMNFADQNKLDENDSHEIIDELRRRKRETDLIGYFGNGIVAFLLPYSEAQAAEAFIELMASRANAPTANVQFATYPHAQFDTLLADSLAKTEAGDVPAAVVRPRRSVSLGVKRAIDVIGSIILLLLAAPLMLVTAVAVKLTSPGPVIFRQTRVGREGEYFPFYKFRSMHCDNDDAVHREYVQSLIHGRHDEVNEGDADSPVYKLQSDTRITAVGRIIRRTSLDELPQLFNVLKGEMSLVGPRPPIPYEIENYQSWHLRRLQAVRPGITGLWQVEGRSTTTFDEMVRLDLQYIRNWSLGLDIKILLKTVPTVVRGEGAD